MITSLYFENFKAFQDYSISLKDFNLLTGPNNSGKSTILDAFRILEGAYRYASRLKPHYLTLPDKRGVYGFEIPQSSIPVILENIQTDFNDTTSSIRYRLVGGRNLYIEFTPEHPVYLYFDTPGKIPVTATQFRSEFPIRIGIVPTLGPLEVNEEIVQADYVKRWAGSRRAPRLFRNFWLQNADSFEEFKSLIERTWDGMSIGFPEKKDMFSKELAMYCYENRIAREVCWAGFGFQIWLQLITHLLMSRDVDILVIDEPEIYLHPDLQKKILGILRESNARIVLATHSVELINNAEPSEVVLIDKRLKSGQRVSDLEGLQRVSNILGSGQNLQLTRLARGKRILFVEGLDAKLLIKFARIVGCSDLLMSGDITIIPIEGFSQHDRISNTNWAFSKILGEELKIGALLDRDYKSDVDIEELKERLSKQISFAHIFRRKEIENYLLIPNAIEGAILEKIEARVATGTLREWPTLDVERIIFEISDSFKSEVSGQLIANRVRKSAKVDMATVIASVSKEFETLWSDINYRLRVIPGKYFLTQLNERLQNDFHCAITVTQILHFVGKSDLDTDLLEFFAKLQTLAK